MIYPLSRLRVQAGIFFADFQRWRITWAVADADILSWKRDLI